jgi:hypothetical protein
MPRLHRLSPVIAPLVVALLLAPLLLPAAGRAQHDPTPLAGADQPGQRPRRAAVDEEGLILFTIIEDLPPAPAYVRLLRIIMEPGAISPLHFHHGPEMGVVETGVATVLVEGPTDLLPRGRTKPVPVADGTDYEPGVEFDLEFGDQILYPIETPMQFRNAQEEEVLSILSAVILPAGSQAPPGLTWVDGPPAANALQGLSSQILGDGVATSLPTDGANLAIERIVLEEGEPVPAYDGPVMLSVESGGLQFVTVEGEVQVSRAADPGPQAAAELGGEFTLLPGDAAYFPNGMEELARPDRHGTVSLLRLTLAPLPTGDATPEASPGAEPAVPPAVVEAPPEPTPTPEPTETPEPTAEPTDEAAATETPEIEPTEAPDDGIFPSGTVVQVTDVGVNMRDGPATSANVVAVLDQGFQLVVVGDPVEADGILWYPVEAADGSGLTGWVAGQFLSEAP